jgi:putative ATP-binding cassette transporter
MPRTPYLPPGTLREVIAYPSAVDSFKPEEFTRALERTGLDHLASKLDKQKRWDKKLPEDEQQMLAFTRVILHKPQWLLIDEVLDAMDRSAYQKVMQLLTKDLKRTGIIHIGKAEAHDHVFKRVLHLVKDPGSRCLAERRPMPDIKAKRHYLEAVK